MRAAHLCSALLAAFVTPMLAHGSPPAQPIIVLKARVGLAGSGDVDAMTSIIDEQFEAAGFASKPETIARVLGGRMPRAGILDRGLSAADLMRPIELGYNDWFRGLFTDAVKKLLPAKEMLLRNPGLLVADTKNLDSTFKGLVALSLSQLRTQPDDAAKTMTELVRIFRTRPVPRGDWGRPAEDYWRSIAKPLLAGPTGQLYVTTGSPQAVIYVDNQIRGIGKAEVDLLPGPHHVLAQVPATAGLQYEVELNANENTYLDIAWDAETKFVAGYPWIGFALTSEAERNRVAAFAGELAHRWDGQGMLVVVDMIRYQGDPMLVGTLYRASGKIVRSAATSLDGNVTSQVRQLAKFLADGTVGSSLKLIRHDVAEPTSSMEMLSSPPRSTLIAKVVGGAGALAFTIGTLVYVTSKADDYTQPTYDDKRSPAVKAVVGGSIVLGSGVYLWLRESDSAGTLSSLALGAGTASILAGSVLYLTDEDMHSQGYQRQYYRDTGSLGIVVGVAGLATAGVGLWLWRREETRPASGTTSAAPSQHRDVAVAPLVSVDPSHVLLGWAGAF